MQRWDQSATLAVHVAQDGILSRQDLLSRTQYRLDWVPVLVLIPAQFGLEYIDKDVTPALKAALSLRQSVGILGGRPNAAYYFVGFSGDQVLFLDPHLTQYAVNMTDPDFPLEAS